MTIIRSAETSRADWIFSADRVIRLIVEFGMSPAAPGQALRLRRGGVYRVCISSVPLVCFVCHWCDDSISIGTTLTNWTPRACTSL